MLHDAYPQAWLQNVRFPLPSSLLCVKLCRVRPETTPEIYLDDQTEELV